ncbi:MAG: SHOCT domain-containing protein [Bacillota bacterium]
MNRNARTAFLVGGVIVLSLIVMSFLGGCFGGWQWFNHDMIWPGMMRGGFSFIMIVVWIVIAALLIWAIVAATRKPGASDHLETPENSALDILKKRYARGEIDKQEFAEKKKDLS